MDAIETERLRLERWSKRYLDDYVRVLAAPETMRYMDAEPFDRMAAEERFAYYAAHWRQHGYGPRFAIEKAGGRWVGLIGLRDLGPEPLGADPGDIEIGWIIAPAAWGNGYATEGSAAIRDHAFEAVGLDRIVARLATENVASARVAEKIGMRLDRQSEDGTWLTYALDRAGWDALVR